MYCPKAASSNLLLYVILVDPVDRTAVVVAAAIVRAGVESFLDTLGPGRSSAVVAERALVGRGGSYMTRVSSAVFFSHCICHHSTYKCLMGCRCGGVAEVCSLVGVGRSSCIDTSPHGMMLGRGTETETGPSSWDCAWVVGGSLSSVLAMAAVLTQEPYLLREGVYMGRD